MLRASPSRLHRGRPRFEGEHLCGTRPTGEALLVVASGEGGQRDGALRVVRAEHRAGAARRPAAVVGSQRRRERHRRPAARAQAQLGARWRERQRVTLDAALVHVAVRLWRRRRAPAARSLPRLGRVVRRLDLQLTVLGGRRARVCAGACEREEAYGHRWPRTVTECHRWPATVAECHRWSATVAECHRWPRTVTECHRWSATVAECHRWPRTVAECHCWPRTVNQCHRVPLRPPLASPLRH